MILLIDNYDSFVHNLARYLSELGCGTTVARNDRISIDRIRELSPSGIVLSPGPRTPREAGICEAVVRELGPRIPILGVCLGHQAIGTALGGQLLRAKEPMHGRTSRIEHHATDLFAGLPSPLQVTRYHSLIVDEHTLPSSLEVTARTPGGVIMALRHREWPTMGVQFHPESVLTEHGHALLENFLRIAGIEPDGTLPREEFGQTASSGENEATLPIVRPVHW
jgi:anthranilate synthase component II